MMDALRMLRVLKTPWNGRFEAHKRATLLGDVVLDKLTVFGNHVFSNAHLFKLGVEGTPFWGWKIVIVENALCTTCALVINRILTTETHCFRWFFAEFNGTVICKRCLGSVLCSCHHALVQMLRVRLVFKEKTHLEVVGLKRVEEDAVLRVGKVGPEFMVPEYIASFQV